jgi:iron-sulfur cluster assembly protein
VFKVTKAAAKELRRSMEHHDFDDMPLRIAARKNEEGAVEYQMGFDEPGPGDAMVASSGIDVLIANEHKPLLAGTELDYVKMEDGEMHFIFLNPNDPTFVPPKDAEDGNNRTG